MRRRVLSFSLVLISCRDSAERSPTQPTTSVAHDERTHDENHFYVAVDSRGFHPATLSVPAGQNVILLFDRRPGTACSGIALELEDGQVLERPFRAAEPLEIHVKLERSGIRRYGCTGGVLQGSIAVP